jgi:hypothetical protein
VKRNDFPVPVLFKRLQSMLWETCDDVLVIAVESCSKTLE